MSNWEHFNNSYVQGYTAALLDVERAISENSGLNKILTHCHKRWTIKLFRKLIKAMIESRAMLRENPDSDFYYNMDKEDFIIRTKEGLIPIKDLTK